MEDKNLIEQEQQELPTQGSGSMLAIERKNQNKTVEYIAEQLNLSEAQIRTIELDQADGLPGPTYVRGYIRSYANLLNMDVERVLSNFTHPGWQQEIGLDDMGRLDKKGTGKFNSGLPLIRIGVVSIFIAAGVTTWYSGAFDQFLGKEITVGTGVTGDNSEKDIPVALNVPLEPSGEVSDDLSQSDLDLSIALEDIPVEESDVDTQLQLIEVSALKAQNSLDSSRSGAEPSSPADPELSASSNSEEFIQPIPVAIESATPTPNNNEAQLTMKFSKTSWVDVRDKENNRLVYKTFTPGEDLALSSDEAMYVLVGSPEAVEVRFNGEVFDTEPYREGAYARFAVNEK